MVDSPGALGDDPCTVTGIRAIDEPGEGLVEVEITVGCSSVAGLRKDRPGEHPWFREFIHRVRLVWNQGQMGSSPEGWIRMEVPRGQLKDFIRGVQQAARDTDAEYRALLARRREWVRRDAQAHAACRIMICPACPHCEPTASGAVGVLARHMETKGRMLMSDG